MLPEAGDSHTPLRVGVLALQGCVKPHIAHFQALGVEVVEVRKASDFEEIEGLVIPGGESTTHLKLIDIFGLEPTLKAASGRMPFWGICAGAIYLAKDIVNTQQHSLNLIDVSIERNAYGRQIESFAALIANCQAPFIRAPKIKSVLSKDVNVIASLNDSPVWVEQGSHMLTTFHPELSQPLGSPMHSYFISKMRALRRKDTPTKG